jgi:tRNA threonylcarbamoyladenosine biosynthesis protein TsaB
MALRIVALETSDQPGQVALLEGDRVVARWALPTDRRSAQTLAPAIRTLLGQADWTPAAVQLVAVSIGPGSFTGLRVGVALAKAFAYATGSEVMGVNALEAIARQADSPAPRLWSLVNAYRQQLFVGRFAARAGSLRWTDEPRVVDIDTWLTQVAPGDAVTGPGTACIAARLPEGVVRVAAENWTPRAETIGLLAWEQYQQGHRDDVWRLSPLYLRGSAAEEKARQQPGPRSNAPRN